MSVLPGSWSLRRLEELITLNPKNPELEDCAAGFMPMAHLGTNFRVIPTFEVRPWLEIAKSYVHFRDGDVLLAKITPCFENGKAGIPGGLPSGIGAGSSEFFVCRPKGHILAAEWLLALFKTREFLANGAQRMTGSVGHKRVPKDFLLNLPVPVPPPAEQRRIANKLDTLLTRVDACRDRLARVTPMLKRFRQSVLAAATSGRLTEEWRLSGHCAGTGSDVLLQLQQDHAIAGGHARGNASAPTDEAHDLNVDDLPENWCVLTLRDACEPGRPITYGILKPGPELTDGVPYIRVADFPGNRLRLDSIKKTSHEIDDQFKRARLRPGDLLLSIRGSVGRIVEIPESLANANITQDTARLTISRRIDSQYVAISLQDESTQRRMRTATRGVAVRGINIGDVRALQVPLPPRGEQTEIVRRVETLFAFADRLEARLAAAQTAADRLTPALLAKAFRGELVPQDPDDEPAAELLTRIRAQRDQSQRPAPRKRRSRTPA